MKILRAVLLVILLATPVLSADNFFLSAGGGLFRPRDSFYKATYGSRAYFPEVTFGARVVGGAYVYAGYSFLSKNGVVPEIEVPSRSKQQFLTGGLGLVTEVAKAVRIHAATGVTVISYSEQTLGIKVSGSKIGLHGELGLMFMIGKRFFLEPVAGYDVASDVVDEVSIRLGGLKASLRLGVVI